MTESILKKKSPDFMSENDDWFSAMSPSPQSPDYSPLSPGPNMELKIK